MPLFKIEAKAPACIQDADVVFPCGDYEAVIFVNANSKKKALDIAKSAFIDEDEINQDIDCEGKPYKIYVDTESILSIRENTLIYEEQTDTSQACFTVYFDEANYAITDSNEKEMSFYVCQYE